jgi:hypothetical protein
MGGWDADQQSDSGRGEPRGSASHSCRDPSGCVLRRADWKAILHS